MKLDVGCGDLPRGDVNCDLFIGKTPHIHERMKRTIRPENIPNFVRCDANHLPFRGGHDDYGKFHEKAFSECICSNVLEHKGVNVVKAFKEMVRVTSGKITVIVPHRFDRERWLKYSQFKEHDKYFTISTLREMLKKMGLNAVFKIEYRYIPHHFVCFRLFRLPKLITFEVMVK